MDYAALVSFTQTIDLSKRIHHKYSMFFDENLQIKRLLDHSVFLRSFLKESLVENIDLESRIKVAANEAEDLLEGFMSWQLEADRGKKYRSSEEVRASFYGSETFKKMQKVIDEIDVVVLQAENSLEVKQLNLYDSNSIAAISRLRQSRVLPVPEDIMVGFDNDLMEMKARLCGNLKKLQVIPIVGMGGIGKTALAKTTYNDKLIAEHFPIRAWVTVSSDYNEREFLFSLLVSVCKENPCKEDPHKEKENLHKKNSHEKNKDGQSIDSMAQRVYRCLKGWRYLIVVDDIWNEGVWDDVKRIFLDDNSGSRILITIRLLDVAIYASYGNTPHEKQ